MSLATLAASGERSPAAAEEHEFAVLGEDRLVVGPPGRSRTRACRGVERAGHAAVAGELARSRTSTSTTSSRPTSAAASAAGISSISRLAASTIIFEVQVMFCDTCSLRALSRAKAGGRSTAVPNVAPTWRAVACRVPVRPWGPVPTFRCSRDATIAAPRRDIPRIAHDASGGRAHDLAKAKKPVALKAVRQKPTETGALDASGAYQLGSSELKFDCKKVAGPHPAAAADVARHGGARAELGDRAHAARDGRRRVRHEHGARRPRRSFGATGPWSRPTIVSSRRKAARPSIWRPSCASGRASTTRHRARRRAPRLAGRTKRSAIRLRRNGGFGFAPVGGTRGGVMACPSPTISCACPGGPCASSRRAPRAASRTWI